MFEFKPTKKGLLQTEFLDRFGAVCSVQESSFQEDDCIWMGVEVDIEGREVANGRMHISRDLANALLPILRHFVRTGRLGVDDPSKQLKLGMWVRGVGPDNHGIEGRVIQTNAHHFTVQENGRAGFDGQHITVWEAAQLYWEPMEIPESVVSRYDRITSDDADDDSV
jgi:hypothetical protein